MAAAGPLGPLLGLAVLALTALGASRLVLLALSWERVRDVGQVWRIVTIGVRLDAMTLGWLLFPAAAVLVCWPGHVGRRITNGHRELPRARVRHDRVRGSEDAFTAPVFRGTWGVSDEDLVRRASATFAAHGDRPFFALMLSTSNHPPFEFPPGRIALFEEPPGTLYNAIKYADSAIGEFFRLAKREPYFTRTLFVVVADHDTRVYGMDLVPVDRFHIPALVIGPGVTPGRYDGLASQIDLLPTLLDLMGLEVDTPLMGRDLVAVPHSVPGHAFMQYDLTNGYRVGDDMIVLAPYERPQQFRVEDGRLHPVDAAPELVRDAIAHAQVPAMLYRERRYRLPRAG